MNEKIKSFIGVLIILALFLISSYIVRNNIDYIKSLIGDGFYGIFIYFLIIIIAIVIAPISMTPLIPLASGLWGWFNAAIIHVTGWFIGSIIVFILCRAYGVDLIRRFVSLKEIRKFESKIPRGEYFLDIVLLRMIVPVDLLSYALGLFSKVNFRTYALATFIGIMPFAFVFSYLGTISLKYQIIGFVVIAFVIGLVHELRKKK